MRQRIQAFLARLAWMREARALPFIVGLAAAFVILSVLIHTPQLLILDRRVTGAIQSLRTPWLDQLAVGFTFLGNTWTLIAVGIVSLGVFTAFSKRRTGLFCAGMLLALPLNVLIKEMVERPRPTADWADIIIPAIGLSYPSGHAMSAVAFYGFLALMSWIHIQRRSVRTWFSITFGVVAALIGLSRVYLGAHWLSDILGGSTAGLILLLIAAELYKSSAGTELAPQPEALKAALV
jgi:undecaprenyl-diphosphatase